MHTDKAHKQKTKDKNTNIYHGTMTECVTTEPCLMFIINNRPIIQSDDLQRQIQEYYNTPLIKMANNASSYNIYFKTIV